MHKEDFVRRLERFDHPRANSTHEEPRPHHRRKRPHDDDDVSMNSTPAMSPAHHPDYPIQPGRAPSPYENSANPHQHPSDGVTQTSEPTSPSRQNAAKTLFSLSTPPAPPGSSSLPSLPPISNGQGYQQYGSSPSYRSPQSPITPIPNGSQRYNSSLPPLYQSITTPTFATGGLNSPRFVAPVGSAKPNHPDRLYDSPRGGPIASNGAGSYPGHGGLTSNVVTPRRPSVSNMVSFDGRQQSPDSDPSAPRKDGGRASISGSSNKRPRASFACESCHRKKIKCQGGTPCSQCAKYQIECVKRTMAPSAVGTDVGSLEERLRRTEDLVARFMAPNTPTTPTSAVSPTNSNANVKSEDLKPNGNASSSSTHSLDRSPSRSGSPSSPEPDSHPHSHTQTRTNSTETRILELEKKIQSMPQIQVMESFERDSSEKEQDVDVVKKEEVKREEVKKEGGEVVTKRERDRSSENEKEMDREREVVMMDQDGDREITPVEEMVVSPVKA